MAIDQHFLPGIIVGLALGRAQPCFGSTIALRRETLNDIGGFAPLANKLADDHVLGMAVRRTGLTVTIPSFVVSHTCSQDRPSELIRHELRWARTIASIDPAGFAGSGVTHALPFALLAVLFGRLNTLTFGAVAAALACRALLQIEVARAFGLAPARLALGPVRDLISFVIYVASFFPGRIEWRDDRYGIVSDGNMTAERINS